MASELLLLRHGEAASSAAGNDARRPLTAPGRARIRVVAEWMERTGLLPGHVVASPAVRTRATAAIVCATLRHPLGTVRWEPRIYEASLDTLVEVASEHLEHCDRVLLVGHNPGLSLLLDHACASAPPHLRRGLASGALVHIRLAGAAALAQGTHTVVARCDP